MDKYVPNVGETPLPSAMRDAIHVAVIPVTAGKVLTPGQRVWIKEDGKAYDSWKNEDKTIGIVDPFRLVHVPIGQQFWLFMFPNTVQNLRHSWTHPAFKVQPPTEKKDG